MPNKYAGIPNPSPDLQSLHNTTLSLKENVELLTGQRRGASPAVTWEDLVRLGLINQQDVPR